jgi:hypothetical protein
MNANAVAKNYRSLTPEERFRLILAAAGRGDEAEQDRLVQAGGRVERSMQDHAPHALAFIDLGLHMFIDLLEEAARYREALALPGGTGGDDGEEEDCGAAEGEEGGGAEGGPGAKADAEPIEDDAGERPAWQRYLDLALAAGFTLKTKADGWKLFCERLSVPPFLLWECLPGFDRLQRALALAEEAAFHPGGFLRWLNSIRPAGEPELTEVPMTAEGVADDAAKLFRARVGWWGG